MTNRNLTTSHVSAMNPASEGADADGTNGECHGNLDGVEPHDKGIIAHVRVMLIFLGKFYEDHPEVVDNIYALCRDLVTGTFMNGLAQYGVGKGSMAGSGNFPNQPATLSETEAHDMLLDLIGSPGNPIGPAIDEMSLLYVLFLSPQTKPSIASGKDDFCGYHQWAKLHDESSNNDVFWALIRTETANQSSGAAFAKDVSACLSHEIAEAVTSRDGRGYFKGDCEIGDLCEQTGTHLYHDWPIEQYWSQWDRGCINGENPVSIRSFLQARGVAGVSLRVLHTPTINVEYIASQFR